MNIRVAIVVAIGLAISFASPVSADTHAVVALTSAFSRCDGLRLEPLNGGGSGGVMSLLVITAAGWHGDVTQTVVARYGQNIRAYKSCSSPAQIASTFLIAEFVTLGNQPEAEANHVHVRVMRWSPITLKWGDMIGPSILVGAPNFPQCECPDKRAEYERELRARVVSAAAKAGL